MLKNFTLRNYKNFKNEISIDFENIAGYQFNMDCLYEGTIGKMLIYGRNATGEYYGAAEPPVRCGESHLSGLTEPPHFVY